MRLINKIIIHYSETPEDREVSIEEITRWHKARGFRDIGYHYVIHLDGKISRGRNEKEAGAHCAGHNKDSIGICYIGGLDKVTKESKDTRTSAQRHALKMLVETLKDKYPEATVHGHNEFSNKKCPGFNVKDEF